MSPALASTHAKTSRQLLLLLEDSGPDGVSRWLAQTVKLISRRIPRLFFALRTCDYYPLR